MAGEADKTVPPSPDLSPRTRRDDDQTAAEAPSMIGRRLGQYILQEKIGHGGMGLVFRAFDTALERTIAVKVMFINPLDDPRQTERFMREARSLARLSHHNLLHVYNVGHEKDCFYFAMELLKGETLFASVQRRRRIPAVELIPMIGQVLSALHYVHDHGITHRDVKSGNVMLCENRAVLMDFGLAKDEHYSGLTSVGVMLGTPDYMSPEAAEGSTSGPATDIYSIGIVMFEALTGKLPFVGRSAMSIIRQHLESAPPRLEKALPDLNPEIARVVYKCLEKKPADRYGDCVVLARDLVRLQHTPELEALSNLKPVPKHSQVGPATAPTKVPDLQAFDALDDDTIEMAGVGAGTPGRPSAGQSLMSTEPDLTVADTQVATKNLPSAPKENKAWPVWVYAAIGFFGVFVLIFVLAIVSQLGKNRPQPWKGQSVVRRRRDNSVGQEFRWIEFRNGDKDPSQWEHVIETREPDGTWKQRVVPHGEFMGQPGDVLELKPRENEKR